MVSKSFKIEELVPPTVFNARGFKSWELIDDKLIITMDAIKARFPLGTMTINNWVWGGDRRWSGLRTPDAAEYYSQTSQHSFGRALDAVFSAYDVEEVRQYILANPEEFPHVKGVELGTGWLHVDVRNTIDGSVKSFYP